MGDSVEERRAHPRYKVTNITGSIFFSMNANVLNISVDGAAIETTERLEPGHEYAMKIIHDQRLMELKGKTVWCVLNRYVRNEQGDDIAIYRAGLMFTDVLTDKAQDLLRFIDENRVEKIQKRLLERFSLISQKSTATIDYPKTFVVKTIGHSGMSIESDVPIDPGSLFSMDLQLKEKDYDFQCRVTKLDKLDGKSKKYLVDIEFLEMNEDDKKVLLSYLSKCTQ